MRTTGRSECAGSSLPRYRTTSFESGARPRVESGFSTSGVRSELNSVDQVFLSFVRHAFYAMRNQTPPPATRSAAGNWRFLSPEAHDARGCSLVDESLKQCPHLWPAPITGAAPPCDRPARFVEDNCRRARGHKCVNRPTVEERRPDGIGCLVPGNRRGIPSRPTVDADDCDLVIE
jgi:hypothetical protein